MAISLTSEAAEHVSRQLASRGKGEGIRIGVKTSGCSGLAYVLEFVDQVEPEDAFFESDGVKVFVDPKSLVYLDGTIVDFAREGLNEGLEFRNPNVPESAAAAKASRSERERHSGRDGARLFFVVSAGTQFRVGRDGA